MNQLKEVRPAVPCDDCLEKEAIAFAPSGGNLKFVYCKHRHVGGSFTGNGCGGGMWSIYTPISESDFAKIANRCSETFIAEINKINAQAKLLTKKN
ncbi:hypothetical protein [Nitrosospira sp. Nsp11]|uniref:hypothetical protein n=1 Tax=Nitrosospira sp. Nsp11 TaxID=1855338 RepID=UPI0011604624|nr:hypothetical protein [Nitrosospira sp. Nsp11]